MMSRVEPPQTRILVVDDRESTRYSTVRVLRAAGAEVEEAVNGSEALQLAARADLLVLDVNLPDIDGFEVCRRLRETVESRHTPIIHLSAAYLSDQHKIHGLQSGADAYLTHPSDPEMLIATINTLLRARRAEESSRRYARLLQSIFSSARVGIAVLDDALQVVEANPAFCRLTGVAHEQAVGTAVAGLLRTEQADDINERLRKDLDEGIVRCGRDGGYCEYTVSAVGDGQRLIVLTDISARLAFEAERETLLAAERASRAAAERANAMKDDFLAVLSHELRNPLNNVLGWAHILRRDTSQASRQEASAAIERNVHMQVGLIEDLLDVSRIATGRVRLELRRTDVCELVSDVVKAQRAAAEQVGIALELQLPAPILIDADPVRLTQICTNLVSNAIKFMRGPGQVQVRVVDEGETVLLAVQDDGIGIAADFLPHIFDRFRQADASITRRAGGLGLGLAIVHSLVQLHGGSVVASSPGVGKGALFEVRLPRQRPGAGEVQPAAATPLTMERPLAGLHIAVVDDSREARRVLTFALEDWGAQVTAYSTAAEALALLAGPLPALLISDLSMPDMDGYQLIRRLRAEGLDAGRLPALALTAFVRGEDVERVRQAGFQGHVAKPVDVTLLLQSVVDTARRAG